MKLYRFYRAAECRRGLAMRILSIRKNDPRSHHNLQPMAFYGRGRAGHRYGPWPSIFGEPLVWLRLFIRHDARQQL